MSLERNLFGRKKFHSLDSDVKAERIRAEYPHMSMMLGRERAIKLLADFYGITSEYATALLVAQSAKAGTL